MRDGLGNITERYPELDVPSQSPLAGGDSHPYLKLTNQSGPQVALDLIKAYPSKSVTYIALGPLTTLAQTMQLDGETMHDRIGRIVCMGGALDVPGNTTPSAECDPLSSPNLFHC